MSFEEFWAAYPRRKTTPAIMGKKKAREKAFQIVKSGEAAWEDLIEGAEKYARCDLVAEGFICMPITWLNQGRWEDEYETAEAEYERSYDAAAGRSPDKRSMDDWRVLFRKPSGFMRKRLLDNWNELRDGPPPGEPDCVVPREILTEYGFIREVNAG